MVVSTVIGEIYEAGSSGEDWRSAGRSMFDLLGVIGGSLRVTRPDGTTVNVFDPSAPGESVYADRYGHIDPIRAAASRIVPGDNWASAVRTSDDIVPETSYHRSEFYCDFARPNGQEHMLLGALGDRDNTVVGFFRETVPFGAKDKELLAAMLPHVQRALELRRRLRQAEDRSRLGQAAFEALPGGALVVDADLNVLLANTIAEDVASRRETPFALSRPAGPRGGSRQLSITSRAKADQLRRLVKDAAQGGSGGALRLEIEHDDDDRIDQLAVLVSQPPQPMGEVHGDATAATVLIQIKELSRPSAPKTSLLHDLFGLSVAEGAVALALLGGQTAETVARERAVSLDTVRSQIRTVLRKTDASNLRDLERMGAILAG